MLAYQLSFEITRIPANKKELREKKKRLIEIFDLDSSIKGRSFKRIEWGDFTYYFDSGLDGEHYYYSIRNHHGIIVDDKSGVTTLHLQNRTKICLNKCKNYVETTGKFCNKYFP